MMQMIVFAVDEVFVIFVEIVKCGNYIGEHEKLKTDLKK